MANVRNKFSIGEAIDAIGFGRFQLLVSLYAGVAYMADAMEVMLLSILGPALVCQWKISDYEEASLTTVVFLGKAAKVWHKIIVSKIIVLGTTLTSPLWGVMADKYGRRQILTVSTFFLGYFAFLSSFSPTFTWMLLLRFLVGIYLAAVPQALTLYAEYMPTPARGRAILILSFYWAIGSSFEALLAWAIMTPNLGWKYLLAISSLPLVIVFAVSFFMPESLLYLAATGQKKRVEKTLKLVSVLNYL